MNKETDDIISLACEEVDYLYTLLHGPCPESVEWLIRVDKQVSNLAKIFGYGGKERPWGLCGRL